MTIGRRRHHQVASTTSPPITSVTADAIYTGPAICAGDSGGPGFLTIDGQQVVAGVISGHSSNPAGCGGQSGMVPVDRYASWVQDQIDANPTTGSGVDAGVASDANTSDAGGNADQPDGGSGPGTWGGGCSTGSGSGTSSALVGLIAAAALVRRRRR